MDKKAIAPIVATLLLIGFAVAVGVVVMNFGQAQVEVAATCAVDVNLAFADDGGKKLCYDGSNIQVTLQNGNNIKVTRVLLDMITTEGTTSQPLQAAMDKTGTHSKNIKYNKEQNGEIRQVKFTPVVTVNKEDFTCTEMALVTSRVPDC
tara:strand:- start:3102 stop:3548 length:447 start_codon:yes stop_codon:yes gene_type:complete